MPVPTCAACGKPRGTNAVCLSCREAVAQGLVRDARDVTLESVPAAVARAERFLSRPPWYARTAPATFRAKVRLLWMVVRDYANGSYRALPWKSVAALVAAILYVVSPVDLIPDFLGPIGLTDDILVVALTWGLVKRELRAYCAWKGLSPAHFGL